MHGIDLDQDIDLTVLPPNVFAEIAPHVGVLKTMPRPPRSTSIDVSRFTDLLARTSLLALDPDDATVFVHRWTASELQRRCHGQGRDEEVRQAHQRAAEYWRWRFDTWPQDRQAAVHDLLEARHHWLACGDIDEAAMLTGHICLQLERWGAWDHATALSHDTLAHLGPDSPRRPVWMHQLGNLAYQLGNYEEAERCYRQSLEIFKQSGDQSKMAISYHQLGMVAQDRGNDREAERRYLQSFHIKKRLDDLWGMALSCHQLGMLAQEQGAYGEAERNYQASLQGFEWLRDQSGMARSYRQLGNLAYLRGDEEEAERRYRQSLQIAERLRQQPGMTASWSQLGFLAAARRRYDEAVSWHIRALLVHMSLQAPQAAYNARALVELRVKMRNEAFVGAASAILDQAQLAEVQAALDSWESAGSDE